MVDCVKVALVLFLSMGSVVFAEQMNKVYSSQADSSSSVDWSDLYVGLNGGYGWGIANDTFSIEGGGSTDCKGL